MLTVAETRREKKIVHASWETLYCLHIVNINGTQNIKITFILLRAGRSIL